MQKSVEQDQQSETGLRETIRYLRKASVEYMKATKTSDTLILDKMYRLEQELWQEIES